MNGEQNENKRGEEAAQSEFPDELVEEVDFDLFAEAQKSSDTQVTADYREAYQSKTQRTPKREKRSRSKKKPEEKRVRAALEAAEQARNKAQKKAAELVKAVEVPQPEPEPELDDFLPTGQEPQEDILLVRKSPKAEAVEGQLDEAEEQGAEQEQQAEEKAVPPVRKHKGKHRYGIGVGALVLVLAFIGLGAILFGIGQQVYRAATDDSQLRAYDTFLSPIVMQDPEPFETVDEADSEMIMKAALWRAVTQNGAQYNNYDEEGRTLVPLGDVVEACHALFGPDCDLQPANPQEETFFEYDAEQNVFRVTPYSSQSSFSPYTVSSKRDGSQTVLRVGYRIGGEDWEEGTQSSAQPEFIKYVQYVLQSETDGTGYYVSAIRADQNKG